jgi:uncharacterized membrane protein YqiK
MSLAPLLAAVVVGALLVLLGLAAAVLGAYYHRLPEGQALVISGTSGSRVCLDGGGLVLPLVNRAEAVDLTLKPVVVDRRGREGLRCRDAIRADLRLVFLVGVKPTVEGVLEVAQSVGCSRAGEVEALEERFAARFVEAAKEAVGARTFSQIFTERQELKDALLSRLGPDLGGFVVGTVAIDHLSRTRAEELDPENILDAAHIAAVRPGR